MRFRQITAAAALLSILPAAFAQDAKPEAKPEAKAEEKAKAPKPLEVGEFTFKPSEAWQAKAEPRAMSQGGYSLMKEGKALMDVDFWSFGKGQGGNTASNINRWQSQFQPGPEGKPPEAKKSYLKYGETKVTLVEIKGTFLSGSMFGPKKPLEGQIMLGAIVDGKENPVFIKMVGAEADVNANRETFRKLLDSAFSTAGVEAKEEEPK